jgi:hypothetical protein
MIKLELWSLNHGWEIWLNERQWPAIEPLLPKN